MGNQSANQFLEALRTTRVVAIVRGDFSVEQYSTVVNSFVRAGLNTIELTIERPRARDAIREISANGPEGLWLGAGTVRSGDDARNALEAGARYLVSPGFMPQVARVAHDAGVVYLPGVLTPSEVETAMASGCTTVKLFPARPLGPAYLKAIAAPLTGVSFVPTGGVGVDDAHEFLEAGALAVGVGGSLVGKDIDPAALEDRAGRLLQGLRSHK